MLLCHVIGSSLYVLSRHAYLIVLLYLGAALLSKTDLSTAQLRDMLADAPSALSQAAAAVHAPDSAVPLPAKLASCNLLSHLLSTQERADVIFSGESGADDASCACACSVVTNLPC